MLYLYDNAIVKDLIHSFNPDNVPNPVVKVVSPEELIGLAAQIQDDHIQFPIVALKRNDPVRIDNSRLNFTWLHKGVATVVAPETNLIYHEKSMPVTLSYELDVLAANQADVDEIVRELMFKYASQYFLSIKVPYESQRTIRFGVRVNNDDGITYESTSSDYVAEGKVYGAAITLDCDGCVQLTYTPVKLQAFERKTIILPPGSSPASEISDPN